MARHAAVVADRAQAIGIEAVAGSDDQRQIHDRDEFPHGDLAYQAAILQGGSCTVEITIPQLPAGLGDVVGTAYLLCQSTDSTKDEPTPSTA